MTRRHRPSKIAATVSAVRRARRRYTSRDLGAPTLRESAGLAVRDAHPRTLGGLAAQGATLAAISGARHGGKLAPVLGLAAVLPAELLIPGPTAAGLAVAGAAGAIAHHRAGQPGVLVGWCGRQLGVAAGATGALAFTGALQSGLLDGMAFWQQLTVLGCTWAPGAIAWWKPRPDAPAIEAPAGPRLPAEMEVLRAILTDAASRERSPILGARIVALDHPAPQVATAVLAVPKAHVRQLPLASLRDGLEALADAVGQDYPTLGPLQPGALEITTTGVSQLQLTLSWSRELSEQKLVYAPPAGLEPGMAWLGKNEDRTDVLIPNWSRGSDGVVSCLHVKIIGVNGSGKSVTARALLYGGLSTATEIVIPLDGKGSNALTEISALVPGQKIAKEADSWCRGIELFGAIFLSRIQRQDTDNPWTHPTPTDPMITLFIDEAPEVRDALSPQHHDIVAKAGKMGRSLGMRVIQASQIPLVDDWVGGGDWRSQAVVTILHTLRDETHARIAKQGLDTDLDLTLLPRHRAVVAFDSHVTASRARVALITPEDVQAFTTVATLDPADQALAGEAWDAYVEAVTVGRAGMGENNPVAADLRALGVPGITTTPQDAAPAVGQHTTTVAPPAPVVPAQTRGRNVIDLRQAPQSQSGDASIRQLILTRLMTTSVLPTRPELVTELSGPPHNKSRSGVQKQIAIMLDSGALIEEAGRIAPAILA